MGKTSKREKRAAQSGVASKKDSPPPQLIDRSVMRRFGVHILCAHLLCFATALWLGFRPLPLRPRQVPRRPAALRFSDTIGSGHPVPFVLIHALGLPGWQPQYLASKLPNLLPVRTQTTSVQPNFEVRATSDLPADLAAEIEELTGAPRSWEAAPKCARAHWWGRRPLVTGKNAAPSPATKFG